MTRGLSGALISIAGIGILFLKNQLSVSTFRLTGEDMAEPTITKICPYCDATIGISEAKCPKCSFDFSELDETTLTNFEKCLQITERKRDRERKAKEKENPQPPAPKKKGFFDALKGRK